MASEPHSSISEFINLLDEEVALSKIILKLDLPPHRTRNQRLQERSE